METSVTGKQQGAGSAGGENRIGVSPAMQAIVESVRQIAPTHSNVLITGETGTSQRFVARAIHDLSPRRDKLYVPLNCAAIPPGLLESELFGHARHASSGALAEFVDKFALANGGTLFLDEVGDMAGPLQGKLLRVLRDGVIERAGGNERTAVDVRVVSSSNRDLASAIGTGKFREDLYHHLNAFRIHIPPLRERPEDIGPLATFLLAKFARELGKEPFVLTDDARVLLTRYHWPGSVRELQNLMERTALLCPCPQVDRRFFRFLLPEASNGPVTEFPDEDLRLKPAVEELERKVILRALGAARDNKAKAAGRLGISERTLWYKLKKYGI